MGRLREARERVASPKGYFPGRQPGSDELTRASVLESKAWVLSLLTDYPEPLPQFPHFKMSSQT